MERGSIVVCVGLDNLVIDPILITMLWYDLQGQYSVPRLTFELQITKHERYFYHLRRVVWIICQALY